MVDAALTAYQHLLLGSPEAGLDIRVFAPRARLESRRLAGAVAQVRAAHPILRQSICRAGWRAADGADAFEHIVAHEPSADGDAAAGAVHRLSAELSNQDGRRFAVSLIDDVRQHVIVALHRAIADDASWTLVLNDLEQAYRGMRDGPAPASYFDWQRAIGAPLRDETMPSVMPLCAGPQRVPAEISPAETAALTRDAQRAYDATLIEAAAVAWMRSLLARSRRVRDRLNIVLQTSARAFPAPEVIPANMVGSLDAFWRLSVPTAALQTLDIAFDIVQHQLREQTLREALFNAPPGGRVPWLIVRMRSAHVSGWLDEVGEFADRADAPQGVRAMRLIQTEAGIACAASPGESWLGPTHPDPGAVLMRNQLLHVAQAAAKQRANGERRWIGEAVLEPARLPAIGEPMH